MVNFNVEEDEPPPDDEEEEDFLDVSPIENVANGLTYKQLGKQDLLDDDLPDYLTGSTEKSYSPQQEQVKEDEEGGQGFDYFSYWIGKLLEWDGFVQFDPTDPEPDNDFYSLAEKARRVIRGF